MEWRPMETAPRDGTEILAIGNNYGEVGKGHHFCIVRFSKRGFRAVNKRYPAFGQKTPRGFHDIDDTSYLTPVMPFLTHWMSLPGPPK